MSEIKKINVGGTEYDLPEGGGASAYVEDDALVINNSGGTGSGTGSGGGGEFKYKEIANLTTFTNNPNLLGYGSTFKYDENQLLDKPLLAVVDFGFYNINFSFCLSEGKVFGEGTYSADMPFAVYNQGSLFIEATLTTIPDEVQSEINITDNFVIGFKITSGDTGEDVTADFIGFINAVKIKVLEASA